MFSISYPGIVFSFVSSNNYSSSASSLLFSTCVSIRLVPSWVLSIVFIWSYGSSKRTGFAFGVLWAILDWVRAVLDVSVFLLNYLGCDPFLWFFWSSCSLDKKLFTENGPLKGQVSSFPLCWIKKYITPLLLSPHTSQYSFNYGIYEVLGIW